MNYLQNMTLTLLHHKIATNYYCGSYCRTLVVFTTKTRRARKIGMNLEGRNAGGGDAVFSPPRHKGTELFRSALWSALLSLRNEFAAAGWCFCLKRVRQERSSCSDHHLRFAQKFHVPSVRECRAVRCLPSILRASRISTM